MTTIKNIVLRRGTKVLLANASATINPGEKVGLVGRNGAGKSSLFRLLDRSLHEDKGDFHVPAQWRMAQVAQDMPETEIPATQFVIEGDTTLLAAQAEVSAAEASDDGERMAYAYMALHDAGAHDAQARAQAAERRAGGEGDPGGAHEVLAETRRVVGHGVGERRPDVHAGFRPRHAPAGVRERPDQHAPALREDERVAPHGGARYPQPHRPSH